jgi:hypothetical protein
MAAEQLLPAEVYYWECDHKYNTVKTPELPPSFIEHKSSNQVWDTMSEETANKKFLESEYSGSEFILTELKTKLSPDEFLIYGHYNYSEIEEEYLFFTTHGRVIIINKDESNPEEKFIECYDFHYAVDESVNITNIRKDFQMMSETNDIINYLEMACTKSYETVCERVKETEDKLKLLEEENEALRNQLAELHPRKKIK